jgi:hypothetical protein
VEGQRLVYRFMEISQRLETPMEADGPGKWVNVNRKSGEYIYNWPNLHCDNDDAFPFLYFIHFIVTHTPLAQFLSNSDFNSLPSAQTSLQIYGLYLNK